MGTRIEAGKVKVLKGRSSGIRYREFRLSIRGKCVRCLEFQKPQSEDDSQGTTSMSGASKRRQHR